jgi:hypothetical protein
VVSFTTRPLHRWYPLDKKIGGPQSRSGRWRVLSELELQPSRKKKSDCVQSGYWEVDISIQLQKILSSGCTEEVLWLTLFSTTTANYVEKYVILN